METVKKTEEEKKSAESTKAPESPQTSKEPESSKEPETSEASETPRKPEVSDEAIREYFTGGQYEKEKQKLEEAEKALDDMGRFSYRFIGNFRFPG